MIKKNTLWQFSTVCRYSFWPAVLVILYLSFSSNKTIVKINSDGFTFRIDYLSHFMAYNALVLIYKFGNPDKKGLIFLLSPGLVSTFLMAIFTEAAQYYIPWRTFNWWDMAMNVGGIAIGCSLTAFYRKKMSTEYTNYPLVNTDNSLNQ
jgi:VanZ family protein